MVVKTIFHLDKTLLRAYSMQFQRFVLPLPNKIGIAPLPLPRVVGMPVFILKTISYNIRYDSFFQNPPRERDCGRM